MQFKSYSTGLSVSLLLLLILPRELQAQLDWESDVVVFGTDEDETRPRIVNTGPGEFLAFCMRESGAFSLRRSLLHGEVWDTYSDRPLSDGIWDYAVCSDDLNTYVPAYKIGEQAVELAVIPHTQSSWPPFNQAIVLPENLHLRHIALCTDWEFAPDDPYVHLFMEAESASDAGVLLYSRSVDRGQSWASTSIVAPSYSLQDSSSGIACAVTWSGEAERIWCAYTEDRPGSTGEQVVLRYSDDSGALWSEQVIPDSSGYAQQRPTLLGTENLLMLAYQRRNGASTAREIFVTYSPDAGVSWSPPLQLTSSAFDDVQPKLTFSGAEIGVSYARAQTAQERGQLLFRRTSLAQPWAWESEEIVCAADQFVVSESYDCVASDDGFALTWSGRMIGDDGDVFFDGSWRGTPLSEARPEAAGHSALFVNSAAGWVVLPDLPERIEFRLYDVLGREIQRSGVPPHVRQWAPSGTLPTGTYWLHCSAFSQAVKLTFVR